MAIAFAQVSIHTRSRGHSAIAAASYRSATKIYDARTGITHDYSHRKDVMFSEILLPEGASDTFKNREYLWNQVELAEKRCDAQLCKDIVLALPKELNTEQQIALTKHFAQSYFVDNGLAADIAIHDHGDGNPHAHILVTTRRLEKNRFSQYKARDLNPAFFNKAVIEQDYWGERWRDVQNTFFQEHQIDVSVDANHLVSERHTGRFRLEKDSYLFEEKELIKKAREEIALSNPTSFIEKIAQTHSVFTQRDIENLVFKTFDKTNHANQYLEVIAQILEHDNVIKLGSNDKGMECYTTRAQYIAEGKLLEQIERLHSRKSHVSMKSLDKLINQYQLNEEQSEALKFIAKGQDISVLVGRPGVGKSYLLKPLKEHYEANGYKVLGAALSGKVAKSLQADTGIQSSTIASLVYRINKKQLILNQEHVLIIDEAGMVDFTNMALLVDAVEKAGAKIVLVGDPDQLKPIHKGEIFRGITAHTGYIALDNIRRQRDEGDRKASLHLAQGNIKDALTHYHQKGAIHFKQDTELATTSLINNWQGTLTPSSIKEHVILAFSRAAVGSLNEKAREAAQKLGIVATDSFSYVSQNDAASILLAQGERILFRQNDKKLGVRNGDLATISKINAHEFVAILDSGEQVVIPKSYTHIDYGYALTVHKSQGMTIDKASVYIDSPYWDRNLAFVAMTRHRDNLKIYANTYYHKNLDALSKNLSRSSTKDNVIDWPLDFALRAGFDSESLIGRAINYIAGKTQNVKDRWRFIVNYEAYLHAQDIKEKQAEQQIIRSIAKECALIVDESSDLKQALKHLEDEALAKDKKVTELPAFDALYQRSVKRDWDAKNLLEKHEGRLEKMTFDNSETLDNLKKYAQRHERYAALEQLAQHKPLSEKMLKTITSVDLAKDYPHIRHLALKHDKKPEQFIKHVRQEQEKSQQKLWTGLCQQYPLLAQYEQLKQQKTMSSGYKSEKLHRSMQEIAVQINAHKELREILKQNFPKVAFVSKEAHLSRE